MKEIILREFSTMKDMNDFFKGVSNVQIISIQYKEYDKSHLVYYTYVFK